MIHIERAVDREVYLSDKRLFAFQANRWGSSRPRP